MPIRKISSSIRRTFIVPRSEIGCLNVWPHLGWKAFQINMRNCWDKLSLMTASIHEEDGRRHCQWSHFSPLDGTLFNKDGSLTYTPSFHCSPLLPLSTFLSYLQILPGRMITLGMIIDGIDDLFTKVYELRADEGRLVSKRVDPREQTSAIRTWKRRLISSPESRDPCHAECQITFASDVFDALQGAVGRSWTSLGMHSYFILKMCFFQWILIIMRCTFIFFILRICNLSLLNCRLLDKLLILNYSYSLCIVLRFLMINLL